MRLGTPELIVILIIILLIFGPKQLPKLGKVVGSAFKSARKQVAKAEDQWEAEEEETSKSSKKKTKSSTAKKKKKADEDEDEA